MDEVNHKGQPQRRRVLRARDVIPPFDGSVPPSDDRETSAAPPVERAVPTVRPARADTGDAVEPAPVKDVEVPTYNLAENILAEQRRAAGRRRQGPARMEDEPILPSRETGVRMFIPEPASQDLLELQRTVAEIVARDIARLCQRPARSHVARASCP